ncbi:MAG: hypothetical protein ACRC33_28175, partial [Gemmataceae bacterium]
MTPVKWIGFVCLALCPVLLFAGWWLQESKQWAAQARMREIFAVRDQAEREALMKKAFDDAIREA